MRKRHAFVAAAIATATLTGCTSSQVARTRITPGQTKVSRSETLPETIRITVKPRPPVYVPAPVGDGGER